MHYEFIVTAIHVPQNTGKSCFYFYRQIISGGGHHDHFLEHTETTPAAGPS